MSGFKNNCIKHLLHDLRFAPVSQRLKIMDAAEQLHSTLDENLEYPYEFVCFKITEYHPKKSELAEILDGDSLAYDLRLFIKKLGDALSEPVQLIQEEVYTIIQLAEKLQVSTKTIHRWRERGLVVRSLIFEDGKRRLGITESALERFLSKNPGLQENAAKFNLLSDSEKEQIIELVRSEAQDLSLSRKQVLVKVASEIGRSPEAIRYTVINFEKANPEEKLFEKPTGVVSPSEASKLYKLFVSGVSIQELMGKYYRSRSSIYRIINQHRVRLILRRKIEFIHSSEFENITIAQQIASEYVALPETAKNSARSSIESLTQYLQAIKGIPLLTRDRELTLFRKYNCLKYLASELRESIDFSKPAADKLRKIEECITESDKIKNTLIESNLRLVVSIATKHINHGFSLSDLISEGNFALMRSIEKFNYEKGFRFNTYASLAIAKDYAKKLPAEVKRPDKPGAADMSGLLEDMRDPALGDVVAIERANKSLEDVMDANLNERERYIVRNHFGISGSLIRKKGISMKQIGLELGISKESVRQIELKALQKLRHSLSREEFELFMG